MSKRNSETWSTNNDEVRVSALFGTLLYVSRVLGAAPVRRRRARYGLVFAVSPTLAQVQRLFAVISNSLLVSIIVMEQQGNTKKQPRQDNLFLTDLLIFIELIFTMLVYGYGVWSASRRLALVRDVWRQLQKIKSSLMLKRITITSEGPGVKYLVFFIIWQIITCVDDVIWTYKVTNKEENLVLFTCQHASVYYQYLTVQMLQLQWSITIMELKSTLTLLNDQLEELLLTAPLTSYEDTKVKLYLKELVPYKTKIPNQHRQGAKEPECDLERIHHLNQCHGLICELMTQVDQDNGPLILLSFMLLFTQLLTSPHSLITELSMIDRRVGAAALAFGKISITYVPIIILLRETNWFLCHFSQLLLLVEPCHRLRDQMERTRALLSKMVGRTDPCTTPAQLNLFVLQARMRDDALVPMGMFVIARPLLASIVGAVATYLMIVFQIQDASNLL